MANPPPYTPYEAKAKAPPQPMAPAYNTPITIKFETWKVDPNGQLWPAADNFRKRESYITVNPGETVHSFIQRMHDINQAPVGQKIENPIHSVATGENIQYLTHEQMDLPISNLVNPQQPMILVRIQCGFYPTLAEHTSDLVVNSCTIL
eukprot:m.333382 g.333382  ORF g.333382 m.333382 type:complete len:149 (+) comp17135_c0_seq1:135-581(+)